MAAYCYVCDSELGPRGYRTIVSLQSDVWPKILSISEISLQDAAGACSANGKVCGHCYTKANKLVKIDRELRTSRGRLLDEKVTVEAELKARFGNKLLVRRKRSPLTPSPAKQPVLKRADLSTSAHKKSQALASWAQVQTPAREKPQKRRTLKYILPASPENLDDSGLGCSPLRQTIEFANRSTQTEVVAGKEAGTQTNHLRIPQSETGVKIVIQHENTISTRCLNDDDHSRILKSIGKCRNGTTIAGHMLNSRYRGDLLAKLNNLLAAEAKQYCGLTTKSVLQTTCPQNLLTFSKDVIAEEMKINCPLVFSTLQAISGKQDNGVVIPACTALFMRNKSMNLLQQVTGQLLDNGGATDQTIRIFNGLGQSVAPSTVYRKKKELAKWGDDQRTSIVDGHRTEVHMKSHLEMVRLQNEPQSVQALSKLPIPMTVPFHNTVKATAAMDNIMLSQGTVLSHVKIFDVTIPTASINLGVPNMRVPIPGAPCTASTISTESRQEDRTNVVEVDLSPCMATTPTVPSESFSFSQAPMKRNFALKVCHSTDYTCPKVSSCKPNDVNINTLQSQDPVVRSLGVLPRSESGQLYTRGGSQARKTKDFPYEVVGDNLDLTVTPTYMTANHQRKSIHWYLMLTVQRRVFAPPYMSNERSGMSVKAAPNSAFLPTGRDCTRLNQSFAYHVSKVITQYVSCLQPFAEHVPEYIPHPYQDQTQAKSTIYMADLLSENQNTMEGAIKISQHVHDRYVTHTGGDKPQVLQQVTQGGDALTCERMYDAAKAMRNVNNSDFEQLQGLNIRPGGLHRVMNIYVGLYQLYYSERSSRDRGTLYQLRNVIGRRDVTGHKAVTKAFRSHKAFVDDALDAHLVKAAIDVLGLSSPDDDHNIAPPQGQSPAEWIRDMSAQILAHILSNVPGVASIDDIHRRLEAVYRSELQLDDMARADGSGFYCPECPKVYKGKAWLKRHLTAIHNWDFPDPENRLPNRPGHAKEVASAFVRQALLARDTWDSYRVADGDRSMLNAKFEFLYCEPMGHKNYKKWLFQMLAYNNIILSPKEAFEYRWNLSVNLKGGIGNNIADDNACELAVKRVKSKLRTQGPNLTFESAKAVCDTLQAQQAITEQMLIESGNHAAGGAHTVRDKSQDVLAMVRELAGVYDDDTRWIGFRNFIDPMARIDISKLNDWLEEKKAETAVFTAYEN